MSMLLLLLLSMLLLSMSLLSSTHQLQWHDMFFNLRSKHLSAASSDFCNFWLNLFQVYVKVAMWKTSNKNKSSHFCWRKQMFFIVSVIQPLMDKCFSWKVIRQSLAFRAVGSWARGPSSIHVFIFSDERLWEKKLRTFSLKIVWCQRNSDRK